MTLLSQRHSVKPCEVLSLFEPARDDLLTADMDDLELLREYGLRKSEQAFATLVSRHANLVYSAALRQVRNPSLAEEVMQAVFILLARKASSIRTGTILPGWLYATTWFTASRALRDEQLRQRREREAALEAMTHEDEDESIWEQIAPLLDEAIMSLGETDRNALLLRFFEQQQFKQVGQALGMTEDAAKKRVMRALERLRKCFAKRRIAMSSIALPGLLAAKTVAAAPAASVSAVAGGALKGTALSAPTLALVKGTIKLMAWTKMKTSLICGATLLLATGTATVVVTNERQRAQHFEALWRAATADRNRALYAEEMRRAAAAWNTPPMITNTTVIDWTKVDSPDYRKYIANMKAIGMPWETIKDIIFADVNKLYAQKAQPFRPPKGRPYWETEHKKPIAGEKEKIEKLNQIEEERKAVLRELVGIESEEEIRRRLAWYAPSGPQLDFLTPEKLQQVQALDKYDLLRDDLMKRVGSTWLKGDFEELKRLQDEKRAALERLLTADELEKYDLVTHPVAAQMRGDLDALNPTEEEFRKIFAIRKAFSDRVGELQVQAQIDPATPAVGLQMAAASKEADQKLEAQLGPQRFADYQRSQDPYFIMFERVSEYLGLSEEAVLQAYQIKKSAEEQYAKLADSARAAGAVPQPTEQFRSTLLAIQQSEEAGLRQALGDKGFEYYKKFNPFNGGPQAPAAAVPK